jgi:hypothetical protein
MGFVPENQVRTGLPAEGDSNPRSPARLTRLRDCLFRVCGSSRSPGETDSFRESDREFEPDIRCRTRPAIYGIRPRKSGSHRTLCWREVDSNLYGAFPVK